MWLSLSMRDTPCHFGRCGRNRDNNDHFFTRGKIDFEYGGEKMSLGLDTVCHHP